MGVPRGGDAHFKESVYELHKRESHGFSPSVSHRLDHEVLLQGAGRRVAGADTNDYPAAVQRTWRPDRLRRFVARTCPMFVEIPPHIAVSDFVRRVKGRSSHQVQMEFPDLRKRLLGATPPPAATSRTMPYFSIFRSTNLPAPAGSDSVYRRHRAPARTSRLLADGE